MIRATRTYLTTARTDADTVAAADLALATELVAGSNDNCDGPPSDAVQAQLVDTLADHYAAFVRATAASSLHGDRPDVTPSLAVADRRLCDLECRTTPPVEALAIAVLALAG